MKRKPIDELKENSKLRGIKTRGKLKKESLITSLLKSEISNAERNYMKYFNTNVSNNTIANNNTNVSKNINFSNNTNASNNTNVGNNIIVSNNNNASNNTNDNTYDGKIRDKISDIRQILCRLGNIVTKNDREKIKKEFYEIEDKTNLSDKEKEKIDDNLLELVNKLTKKEKYRYHDLDD